jgi:phosphoribosylformimino-5-aminoimidazole carboxamide ribotide isomerase
VAGWLETTNLHIIDFITYYHNLGVQQIFCTDIAKDGMLQGSSVDLYKKILQYFPALHLIASGGVANLQDIVDLANIGCQAVIVGKAIYEGRVQLNDLQSYF